MPKRPYPRWERRHEAVLLWLVEHPEATLAACARVTSYSPSHLSRITCSPAFRQHYHALQAEQERRVIARAIERLVGGGPQLTPLSVTAVSFGVSLAASPRTRFGVVYGALYFVW